MEASGGYTTPKPTSPLRADPLVKKAISDGVLASAIASFLSRGIKV